MRKTSKASDELLQAIREQDRIGVKVLLQSGANPNAVTQPPAPPPWWKQMQRNLRHAIERSRGEFVIGGDELQEFFNHPAFHPIPAIVLAVSRSRARQEEVAVAITELLLDHGADPDAQDGIGTTALIQAANDGLDKIVDLLLTRGANVNLVNHSSHTALMITPRTQNVDVMKRILQSKPNLDAQDNLGATALMDACFFGRLPMVRLLLDAGANRHLTNRKGEDALSIAKKQGCEEIVRLLTPLS